MSLTALQVLTGLLLEDLRLPPDCRIELITHKAFVNWRQLHPTPREKVRALPDSLVHEGPYEGRLVTVSEVREISADLEQASTAGLALSVTSRIWTRDNRFFGHMALMNLHTEGFAGLDELSAGLAAVTEMPGYLVRSGRFFHYYGKRLLSPAEWLCFLAQFLMPCTVVSPRYIGHSIDRGFCTLRLNAVAPEKPFTPRLERTI